MESIIIENGFIKFFINNIENSNKNKLENGEII
jgi:hypothetical protein